MDEERHEPERCDSTSAARLRGWTARHPWTAAAVIFVCAVAPFAGGLRGGFVTGDRKAIEDNPVVERGLAGFDPLLLLRTDTRGQHGDDATGSYRPLTVLTFVFDAVVGSGAPWVFHLTNLLWHTAVCYLIFCLALRLFGHIFGREAPRTSGIEC